MFDLKTLSPEAIDRSLAKAQHYRLLNEPVQAESICLDVLRIEPAHQQAFTTLLLALTDQFGHGAAEAVTRAREVVPKLHAEYDRAYYSGIIFERRASARLHGSSAGGAAAAYDLYHQAMDFYATAEALSPPGNEDARLRWNTCARQIERHKLVPPAETGEPLMLE